MGDCSSFQFIFYIFDLHPVSEEGSPWLELGSMPNPEK